MAAERLGEGVSTPAAAGGGRYNEARLELLLKNIRAGLFHNLGFAAVVVTVLAGSAVPKPVLAGWGAAMLLGLALRYLMVSTIKRWPDRIAIKTWLWLNVLSAGFMGILWGACGLSMFYGLDTVPAAVVMFAIAGITAGVAANGHHRPYLAAYLVPALAPLALYFLMSPALSDKAMAGMVLLYGFILFRIGQVATDKLRYTTDLASENEDLVDSLSTTLDESRRTEERFQIIANYSYAWECWFDTNGHMIWTSPSVERITGYRPSDFQANPALGFDIIHPDDADLVRRAMAYAVNVPSEGDLEFRIIRKDGSPRWVAAVSNPIYDKDGNPCGIRSSIRDLSVQKKLEEELQSLASTDSLTGTLNRRAFLEKANEEVYRSARYDKPMTVAMFDLDHFKQVNDTYGHNTGDRCIVMLTDLVQTAIRQSDLFARFGGEEFVLLLPETELAPALQLCERLRRKVESRPVETDGDPIKITVSVGVADFQQNRTLEEIIAQADAALYTAKRNGRNQVAYGSTVMSEAPARSRPAGIDKLGR